MDPEGPSTQIVEFQGPRTIQKFRVWILGPKTLPRGSYPNPFLGRLHFKITGPNHQTRYPKKGGRV